MKKRVVILFPNEWVAYSPTILNLVDVLKKNSNVKVFAFGFKLKENIDQEIFSLISSCRKTPFERPVKQKRRLDLIP